MISEEVLENHLATLRRHYQQISKKTPTTKDVPAYGALQTVRRRTNWGEDLLPDKRQRFLDLDPDIFTKKKAKQNVKEEPMDAPPDVVETPSAAARPKPVAQASAASISHGDVPSPNAAAHPKPAAVHNVNMLADALCLQVRRRVYPQGAEADIRAQAAIRAEAAEAAGANMSDQMRELCQNVSHKDVKLFRDLSLLLQETGGEYPPLHFPAMSCRECGQCSPEDDPLSCLDVSRPWCRECEALGLWRCGDPRCYESCPGVRKPFCGRLSWNEHGPSWCQHGIRLLTTVGNAQITTEFGCLHGNPVATGLSQLGWIILSFNTLRRRAREGSLNDRTKQLFETLPGWSWDVLVRRTVVIVELSGSLKCRENDDEDSDQGFAPRSDSSSSNPSAASSRARSDLARAAAGVDAGVASGTPAEAT